MTDPAVEAANRAAEKVMVCGLGSKLYPSDLILAAREALSPLRELHKPVIECCQECAGNMLCSECEWEWPCPTAKLIYREDEL